MPIAMSAVCHIPAPSGNARRRAPCFRCSAFSMIAKTTMQRRLISLPCKPFRPYALALGATLLAATAAAQPADEQVIDTVAGTGRGGFSGDGGPSVAAQLANPRSVALDAAGNLFIADWNNHRIRKVDVSTGNISTVAGTGQGGFGDEGGPAVEAPLANPRSVALDAEGNLYIAEEAVDRIRRVDAASGIITTIAGNGNRGFSGDGGPAVLAQLANPRSVALDAEGNLYIADAWNNLIRKVDASTGNISTVAGTGRGGGSGDGGPAVEAQLYLPSGVAVDGSGNIYIADTDNHRIRKVDAATGNISTVAGSGWGGYIGDGVPAVRAQLYLPSGVAVDGAGNIYIAGYDRIRKVGAAGVISTVVGTGELGYSGDGGPAVQAQLSGPSGVAVDGAGNIYIADTHSDRIRKVDATGVISTVAGTGKIGYSGDGGPAAQAHLAEPRGVALDAAGNLYIADTRNHRIRRLSPADTPRISAGGIVLATGAPLVNRISPNAIVSIFGHEFAQEETRSESPALNAAGRVATELAGLCLEIDGKRAPLFAVFPGQINAQAPHDLALGQTQVTAIRNCGAENEQRSFAAAIEVTALSPAFFNFHIDAGGRNPIVALRGEGPALAGLPGAVSGVELVPAEPGEIVTFFGTGFGPTDPPLEAGQIPGAPAPITGEIEFTLGGITLFPEDVLYAGAVPCCAGLYQFTVRVPRSFPDSLRAPVVAAVNGVPTPEGPFLTVRRRE